MRMLQTHNSARLAQLGERRSAEREVASSNPGRTNTQGLKNNWGESAEVKVFSDKDDKPEVPSHKPCSHITLWDPQTIRKE